MRYCALVFLLTTAPAQDLLPVPAKVTIGTGKLAINRDFKVLIDGCEDDRVGAAVKRFEARLAAKTGTPLRFDTLAGKHGSLAIHCDRAGEPVQKLGEDESYKLVVTQSQARLTAPNALGILRGLETFYQLVEPGTSGFVATTVAIEDSPRFPWRGLLLDVCRHWMPLEVVLRNLDGMAAVKMNVFHWHLSDDQGFRVESKRFPKLHELGSDGHYYTQDQVRQALAYARERGIRVVPEFDMPAHTASWLAGYPELGSAPGPYEIARTWSYLRPTLDPTRESVYTFLDGFIGEMANLFPDEYFHIGGDEVNGRHWDSNADIQSFKKEHGLADNKVLQAYFNARLQSIVKKHGKRMEGWDDILDPSLPKDVLIQSWRGRKSLAQAGRLGYDGVLSAPYYLDAMKSAAEHYLADPLDADKGRIEGGEVCAWGEFLTPENVDSRIWPRTAAMAERLWSPLGIQDLSSMYRRLAILSGELETLGLQHVSSYGKVLERLRGGGTVEALRVLADVVAPVRMGLRMRTRVYTQQTPLNRLCDGAAPESDSARLFLTEVERRNWKEVRAWLIRWRDNDVRLRPTLDGNQLIQELVPLSADLSALGAAGLRALDSIETGRSLPRGWVLSQRAFLLEAKKPRAEVTLQIVPGIAKLLSYLN